MNAQASERMSAAKTGWVIVLLMAAWAAFLVLPFGREEKSEASKVAVPQPSLPLIAWMVRQFIIVKGRGVGVGILRQHGLAPGLVSGRQTMVDLRLAVF